MDELKENMYACAWIYIEVDLEKGLQEYLLFTLDNCKHVQQLDYEHLPFKCKSCHKYKHFS